MPSDFAESLNVVYFPQLGRALDLVGNIVLFYCFYYRLSNMRAHVRRMAERRWNPRSRWLDIPGERGSLVLYLFFLHLVSSFLPSKLCPAILT